MKPELIADYACITGEGPLWHPDEKKLYWVDIPPGRMFVYDPVTGEHSMVYEGDSIGGMTLQPDGSLLLFMAKGAVRVWRDGAIRETIIEEIPDEVETRFNDVIAAPCGRVFCGTMPTKERKGRLYRLELDGSITLLLEDIGCSNGMGFTPDLKQMYYTDTTARKIYIFDYCQDTGAITNQRVFVETPNAEGEGMPDGMTVDAEGYVWGARWDGGCLVRYDPEGNEVQRLSFPAKKVSCVTFGGDDYADMYITTAGADVRETDGPMAGALFRVDPGVRGVPEFRSRVGL